MSKSKVIAKTASKNNPAGRSVTRKYLLKGKEIRPVKIIAEKIIQGAFYIDNDQLVTDNVGAPLPWKLAASMCSLN